MGNLHNHNHCKRSMTYEVGNYLICSEAFNALSGVRTRSTISYMLQASVEPTSVDSKILTFSLICVLMDAKTSNNKNYES